MNGSLGNLAYKLAGFCPQQYSDWKSWMMATLHKITVIWYLHSLHGRTHTHQKAHMQDVISWTCMIFAFSPDYISAALQGEITADCQDGQCNWTLQWLGGAMWSADGQEDAWLLMIWWSFWGVWVEGFNFKDMLKDVELADAHCGRLKLIDSQHNDGNLEFTTHADIKSGVYFVQLGKRRRA